MGESEVQTWEAEIPADVLRRAYVSGNEFAWPKADAIQVVQTLQRKGYRILGVDTWIPTRPGPTPFGLDWDERSPISQVEFIETFVWASTYSEDEGLELHVNLTVDDREEA